MSCQHDPNPSTPRNSLPVGPGIDRAGLTPIPQPPPRPLTSGSCSINLATTDGVTPWIPVGPYNKFSCEIIPASGYTNASWVVDLEWVLCTEATDDRFQTFDPDVQATYAKQYIANQSVTNRGYVRGHTSTAEPGADPAAKFVWSMKLL